MVAAKLLDYLRKEGAIYMEEVVGTCGDAPVYDREMIRGLLKRAWDNTNALTDEEVWCVEASYGAWKNTSLPDAEVMRVVLEEAAALPLEQGAYRGG